MKQSYTNSNHIASLKNWGTVASKNNDTFPWQPLLIGLAGGMIVGCMICYHMQQSHIAQMAAMRIEAND